MPSACSVLTVSQHISICIKAETNVTDLQEIIQFIFFPVVNEGCRVIDEGIVDKPSDLDVATVMSMGFPAYRYETTCSMHATVTAPALF